MVRSGEAQICSISNVRVFARVRPPSLSEKPGGTACLSDNTLEVLSQDGSSLHFTFEKVHGPPKGAGNTQADIFSDVQDIVLSALQGFNGCVMAFGQTGSGKTYTLAGDLDSNTEQGLLTRSVKHLAQGISEITDGSQFQVHLSVVEIYCESIKDLLSEGPGSTGLAVQQDKELGIIIAGATKVAVTNESELVELTQQGLARRTVASTSMNAASSRSHCLVTLTVQRHLPGGSVMHGKLTLVDLAGSERQDKTLAEGLTFEEGKLINKSLSALGNVVKALADNPSGHIPYRDSKLTRALQDTLGGKARMALIICCSPAASNAAETLSSLRFGTRAKGIMTSVQAPAVESPAETTPAGIAGMELHEIKAVCDEVLQGTREVFEEVRMLREENARLRAQAAAAANAGANAARVENGRGAGVRFALLLMDAVTVVMSLVAVCTSVCKALDLMSRWVHNV